MGGNKMDLRIQKTYMALTNTFMELMLEKGFDEITVNELCARSLVGRGTFYKHFADKYEFLSFVVREQYRSFLKEISYSANNCSYEQRINALLTTSLNFIEQSPAVMAALQDEQGNSIIQKAISDVVVPDFAKQIKEMQTNGLVLPFDAALVAELAVTISSQTIMWWIRNREAVPKEAFLPFLYKNVSCLLSAYKEDIQTAMNGDCYLNPPK